MDSRCISSLFVTTLKLRLGSLWLLLKAEKRKKTGTQIRLLRRIPQKQALQSSQCKKNSPAAKQEVLVPEQTGLQIDET